MCKHELIEQDREKYIDYQGYKVIIISYKCIKCGKIKKKKYW